MRKTEPDLPRPYRCWGYPWVPALFRRWRTSPLTINIWIERPRPLLDWLAPDFYAGLPFYRRWNRALSTRGDVWGETEPKFLVLCRMKS